MRTLPLDAMVTLARTRDVAALSAELSTAFLFCFATATNALPSVTSGPRDDAQAGAAPPRFWVLRRKQHSTTPFISVGRLDGNDVALGDASVSRFHAMIFEDADGFSIVNASKLGTFVDEVAAPARGRPPLRLRSQQMIRFGGISALFVLAADAIAIARSHSWSASDPRKDLSG